MRGSSASRIPSPMKFTLSTVSEIASPGQKGHDVDAAVKVAEEIRNRPVL